MKNVPPNTVFTVTKYDPMGTTTMASVKASSFSITSLGGAWVSSFPLVLDTYLLNIPSMHDGAGFGRKRKGVMKRSKRK